MASHFTLERMNCGVVNEAWYNYKLDGMYGYWPNSGFFGANFPAEDGFPNTLDLEQRGLG